MNNPHDFLNWFVGQEPASKARLRAWLAGQALAGMGATWGMASAAIAEKAVEIADATMAELAKEK